MSWRYFDSQTNKNTLKNQQNHIQIIKYFAKKNNIYLFMFFFVFLFINFFTLFFIFFLVLISS